MHQELGIDTLLELDQQILDQGNGYWIKIEARWATPTKEIPHGIGYSLTLHEPYDKRILCPCSQAAEKIQICRTAFSL